MFACCNECCLTANKKIQNYATIPSVKLALKIHFRLIIYNITSLNYSMINSQVDQSWLNNLVVLTKTSGYKTIHNTSLVMEYRK